MSKPTKIAAIGAGCLVAVLIAIPLGYFILTRLLYQVTGEPFFDSPRDRAKLVRIAEPYDAVILAVERHRSITGKYPERLEDLDATIEATRMAQDFLKRETHTVYYRTEQDYFTFHVKLNWDGGLVYRSGGGHWRYDPGNGDPDWPIR